MKKPEKLYSEYSSNPIEFMKKNNLGTTKEVILFLMEEYAQSRKDNWIKCRELELLRKLLNEANCPSCDGSGTVIEETTKIGTKWVDDGHGNPIAEPTPEVDFNPAPCEWCYYKEKLIESKPKDK